ncbi:hypothetical protein TNCV_4115531 [Trichonephila clavipes]|nr:hypothetical protein TNCV_4115531 [Trichonephila clavipes]
MENANLWLFTKELANTPNRKRIDEVKESSCRKMGFDFVKEIRGSLKAYPFWFKYFLQENSDPNVRVQFDTHAAAVLKEPTSKPIETAIVTDSNCYVSKRIMKR